MRRFEQQTEQGVRFWEIEQAGGELTMRSGKVGSKAYPEERNESYRNVAEAKRAAEKLIRSRLNNGFVERVEKAAAEEIEAQLATGDEQAWLVFADRLLSEGDSRGELITLQHRLGKKRTARKQIAAFVEAHGSALLGPLEEFSEQLELGWQWGYLADAKLFCRRRWDERGDDQEPLETLLPMLLSHESARFLRTLRLGWPEPDRESSYEAVLDTLLRSGWPKYLQRLVVGDFTASSALSFAADFRDDAWLDEDTDTDLWPDLRSLGPLAAKCGGLKALEVRANLRALGSLSLPSLRFLSLAGQHLLGRLFEELWAAKLPALEGLVIEVARSPDVRAATFQSVLDGALFPRLTRFGLGGLGLEAVEALAASPRLPALKEVELSANGLTDEAIPRLLELGPRFAHLEKLWLQRNCFTKAGTKELKQALPNTDLSYQQLPRRERAERYDDIRE